MPKSSSVLFASKFQKHRLVMEPKDYEWKGPRIHGETRGHAIEFENNNYRTDDPAEIEFLRSKIVEGNVYEIPEQVPDPSPILAELAVASEGRTRQILTEELDGWERDIVIRTCEAKLAGETVVAPLPEGDDPEAPFGRKEDGTPRKRRVPTHLPNVK